VSALDYLVLPQWPGVAGSGPHGGRLVVHPAAAPESMVGAIGVRASQ
jgi:hypothetical protein